ncbi:MAG: tyrosine-type recombinase/integrase [Hyphomicrobiales bacterium]|nr:tyrosine-type recombinase/integrase [Hyphomicrobiales bacterium]
MTKKKLTKSVVEGLPPAEADYVAWDAELPGFGVRVKPSGIKSYVVQYRNRKTGASRRKTIGQHGPLLTFHKAREQARIILADALKGNDPIADDRAIRGAPTMKELAADYLEQHAIPKKRPRSVENDRSMLDRIILPRLGSKKINAVQSQDIHALHVSMRDSPYQANRVLALMSKMFSLAMKWGWRGDNPVKGIERFHEERRERWLSDEELGRLLNALSTHPNHRAANAVRFQLLTGARIGEVLSARWSDIDLTRGVWIKPSHHTKQKRTEHLPLSAPALALLAEMRERANPRERFLFPGNAPDKPLQGIKKFWRGITEQAGLDDYRLHDNRHTHASHLVSSGLSLEIVGRLLGHTNPLTTKRYAHLADDPLRAAAERFGSKMDALQDTRKADIVPIPSRR